MMFLGEEKGDRVNVTRAKELVATGASTVATACPFCRSMFTRCGESGGVGESGSTETCWIIVQITALHSP